MFCTLRRASPEQLGVADNVMMIATKRGCIFHLKCRPVSALHTVKITKGSHDTERNNILLELQLRHQII